MNIDQIFSTYSDRLKRFLHGKVSNSDDVDDLFQEIFLKTFQNLDTLQSSESLESWLYRIAHRTVVDYYRKKGRPLPAAEDLWQQEQEDSLELLACLQPFIAELDDESRELIERLDLEGESQKAYAEAHNLPYSTLKSRLHKARLALRDKYYQCCEGRLKDDPLGSSCCS